MRVMALRSCGEGPAVAEAVQTAFTIVDADEMLESAMGRRYEHLCPWSCSTRGA